MKQKTDKTLAELTEFAAKEFMYVFFAGWATYFIFLSAFDNGTAVEWKPLLAGFGGVGAVIASIWFKDLICAVRRITAREQELKNVKKN